jgi:hypothetical protein
MLHNNPETGWTFECLTDSSGKPLEGGLVLQKVRHQGHNFAKDIRTVGIWLSYETVDGSGKVGGSSKKLRLLGSKWGFNVSAVEALVPKPILNHPTWKEKFEWLKELDALNFSDYFQDPQGVYSGYGVMAKYDGPNLFADLDLDNCEYSGLSIAQRFLFSRYADEPPHEPSGALDAARFHPLIDYEFTPNSTFDPSKTHARITSIRFDYRLHLYLDNDYQYTERPNMVPGTLSQQAGLFADRDSLAISPLKDLSEKSFFAVEKPLVREVTAPGLLKGVEDGSDLAPDDLPIEGKVLCWDNIHWWALRYPPLTYISSPGAFHAAHCHWRWGAALNKVAALVGPFVDAGPHFTPGQPLMDPGIFMQTIRVAVTKNQSRFDPAKQRLVDLSDARWESLFENHDTPPPEDIHDGADIVLWYSSEVHRQVTIPSRGSSPFFAARSGTVFLHGIFFAHDAEQTGITVGPTSSDRRPRTFEEIDRAKKWFRPASN